MASLDQPKASANTTGHGSRTANSRIMVLLRAPPPQMMAREGLAGKCRNARAIPAAVKAVSVAAASSVDNLSTTLLEKLFLSRDFGGGAMKKGWARSSS